jgi:hypothetical protein
MKLDFNKLSGLNLDNSLRDPILEQNDYYEIRELSKDGLNKITSEKNKIKTLQEEHEILKKRVDMGKDLYEEYDDSSFEVKTKIDLVYYDQLLQKMEETADVEPLLGGLYQTVREIYEHINIKPEIYGNKITPEFLNESFEIQKRILSESIYDYVENKFYKLSPEKRQETYINESTDYAKQLIKEGTEPEQAIQHAIKTVVMEGLLSRIAFPKPIQYRINYLMEDENYRKVFDQEKLISLWESFNNQIHEVSKLVAKSI